MDKFSGSGPKDPGDVCRWVRQQQRERLKAQPKPPIDPCWARMERIIDGQEPKSLDAGTYLQKFRLKQ